MSEGRSPRHFRFVVRGLAFLVLLAAVAVLAFVLPVREHLFGLLEWVRGMGAWGPLLLGVIYVLACVLFVPGSLLTLGAGFLFGVVVGTVTVSLASTLGACAAFLLGRTLARGWVEERVARDPRFRALDEAIGQQGFRIVLLVRLSPAFPFNLLNYALGLTRVSFRAYALASWLGMFPATVMYVYLGSTIRDLTELSTGSADGGTVRKVLFGVGLAATVAVALVVTRLARRALREAVHLPEKADGERPVGGTDA